MQRRHPHLTWTACTVLLSIGAVAASAQPVPLNYNWNGLLQASEWSGGWPGDPGVADVPDGYRSISDRGLRVDGLSGAINAQPLVGATGLTYTVSTSDHVVDMVLLGNRNTVDGGGAAFDTVVDTDNHGIVPTWLPNPDLTGPQTSTFTPILLSADSQIGVLYNISNGGGYFDIVLHFTDYSDIAINVGGPDWFNEQSGWFAGNSIPSPIPPYNGIASLSRIGAYTSVFWVDNPAQTTDKLNVVETVITVTQLLIDGFGDLSGKHLSSISFQGRSNESSYGIYALSVGGGAPPPANDNCATATLVTEGIYASTSGGATGSSTSSCGWGADTNDVWYRYHASTTGTARASLCGSAIDTTLAVYASCGGAEIACNDDFCLLQSQVEFPVVAAADYFIRIAGNGGSAGSFMLTITNPPNILYGPAVNPANGHSYYMLTPLTWADSEYAATQLGGHLVTMNNGDEQTWVINNVLKFDGRERKAWIGFTDQALEGAWRWINRQIVTFTSWNGGEPNNAGGTEHVAEMQQSGGWNDVTDEDDGSRYGIVEIPTPPANDVCATATPISEGEIDGDSDGATGTTTSSCGVNDTADVWFDYTASRTGTTRISLCSDPDRELLDNTLAVYSACGGAQIACNDNFCGEQPQIDFAVVAGAHYFVRVAGNAGFTGGFRMDVTNPPGVLCGPTTNPANGSQYYTLTKQSWTSAEAAALALGGHLATVNDAAENAWIVANMLPCAGTPWAWIGLYETSPGSGIWTWVSGQIASFRNWDNGEPNNLETELYAEIIGSGAWNNLLEGGHYWLSGEYAVVEIDGPGACCLNGTQCTVLTPANCTAQSGLFLGGGTTCTPNPCAAGSCCQPDGSCAVMTPANCVAANGMFTGAPTCDPNPCIQPGACCVNSVCSLSPTIGPAWCTSQSGLYQGDDTTCATTPCPAEECLDAGKVYSDLPVYGTNVFAGGTDITSCADNDFNDVWYKWTAPECDASASFSLCDGSSMDSTIAVFSACGGAEIVCDDDGCGTVGGPSTVTINATAGTTYYIRVAGWDGSTGNFKLTVSNAPCMGACCIGSTCAVMPESACADAGGTFHGSGVPCTPGLCACPGDTNCNGQVDFADINPFVVALLQGVYCDGTGANADTSGNGMVGFEDINPFVILLTQNPLPIHCQ